MRRHSLAALSLLSLMPVAAAAYTLSGNQWKVSDGPVEYYIATQGTPDITDGSHEQAVQNAFHTWECVLCSSIQFRYMGPGPNGVAQDGKNTVLWVSNPAVLQQLVGASDTFFSVSINFDPMANPFFEQDIVLNDSKFMGKDLIWSTTNPSPMDAAGPDGGPSTEIHVDVETVLLSEVGIFMGLKPNCDANGMNCHPPSETVLSNTYIGVQRELRQDDKDGACALYPGNKTSCELKKLFDPCERDCDCDPGLLCVPDGTGRVCSKPCDASTGICPNRSGCVLVPGQSGGLCLRNADGNKKLLGMACTHDSECQVMNCSPSSALGRSVCSQSCATSDTCGTGYSCLEGTCLLSATGDTVPCESAQPPPPSDGDSGKKACSHVELAAGFPWLGVVLLGLVMALRRRS